MADRNNRCLSSDLILQPWKSTSIRSRLSSYSRAVGPINTLVFFDRLDTMHRPPCYTDYETIYNKRHQTLSEKEYSYYLCVSMITWGFWKYLKLILLLWLPWLNQLMSVWSITHMLSHSLNEHAHLFSRAFGLACVYTQYFVCEQQCLKWSLRNCAGSSKHLLLAYAQSEKIINELA